LRWLLPLVLFVFATGYEVWEHVFQKGDALEDINMAAEVLIFGVIGPIVVFLVLTYVGRLIREHEMALQQLRYLNLELEERVAARTRELEARNQELVQVNTELKQVDQLKSDFIALVSHELLTPLTTVNGGLELLMAQRDSLPPDARQRLSILSREIQRLTTLVQEILDLSRLQAGKLRLNYGPIALGPLLMRVLQAVDGKRQVHIHMGSASPPLWGDEVYVEEILRNIIDNALKHTPDGRPIEIEMTAEEEYVHLSVTDYGPGIPAEHQEHIFERFYRVRYGERQDTTGWGLGLYLARRLAEIQGGTITVQSPVWSNPEHPGTRFTITLPVAVEEPEDEATREVIDSRR